MTTAVWTRTAAPPRGATIGALASTHPDGASVANGSFALGRAQTSHRIRQEEAGQ